MRYRIEYRRKHTGEVLIHVDRRLIKGSSLCYNFGDNEEEEEEEREQEFEKQAKDKQALLQFCRVVEELDGIEDEIVFARHVIHLTKGSLFRWQDIIPHVIEAIRLYIAKDQKMEEHVKEEVSP